MHRLAIPQPSSAGLLLTYKCTSHCQHCLYACSPRWEANWLSLDDAQVILAQLAPRLRRERHFFGVGVNQGLHFTGGEPFLNFPLLLEVTTIAQDLGIPSTFVETNCFWCTDDGTGREKLRLLKEAGLDGILISVNPFIVEQVPFERIERAVRLSMEAFPGTVMVYQRFFYDQFRGMGLQGTLPFTDYMQSAGYGLSYAELLPGGRVPFKLAHLFREYPAQHFLAESCYPELIRDWHIHIDNYGNFVPGYCGGLSLGDGRDLDALCRGINLDDFPVLRALLTRLEELYRLGKEFGYQDRDGYISKCHLCLDIRRHLSKTDMFKELAPLEFYAHLED